MVIRFLNNFIRVFAVVPGRLGYLWRVQDMFYHANEPCTLFLGAKVALKQLLFPTNQKSVKNLEKKHRKISYQLNISINTL